MEKAPQSHMQEHHLHKKGIITLPFLFNPKMKKLKSLAFHIPEADCSIFTRLVGLTINFTSTKPYRKVRNQTYHDIYEYMLGKRTPSAVIPRQSYTKICNFLTKILPIKFYHKNFPPKQFHRKFVSKLFPQTLSLQYFSTDNFSPETLSEKISTLIIPPKFRFRHLHCLLCPVAPRYLFTALREGLKKKL